MKNLLPFLLLFVFFACEKDENLATPSDCDARILEQFDMVPFDGDDTEWCVAVYLYKYETVTGDFLYERDSPCANMFLGFYNCAGENICTGESPTISSCPGAIGVIGIQE